MIWVESDKTWLWLWAFTDKHLVEMLKQWGMNTTLLKSDLLTLERCDFINRVFLIWYQYLFWCKTIDEKAKALRRHSHDPTTTLQTMEFIFLDSNNNSHKHHDWWFRLCFHWWSSYTFILLNVLIVHLIIYRNDMRSIVNFWLQFHWKDIKYS